jgi:hypothetical protein
LRHVADGRQDVGDHSGRRLDLGSGQLAEEAYETAVAGELCLAEQA